MTTNLEIRASLDPKIRRGIETAKLINEDHRDLQALESFLLELRIQNLIDCARDAMLHRFDSQFAPLFNSSQYNNAREVLCKGNVFEIASQNPLVNNCIGFVLKNYSLPARIVDWLIRQESNVDRLRPSISPYLLTRN